MQISENSDELYDELTIKIEAGDDPAARRVFQELLKTGRSRQEVVIQVEAYGNAVGNRLPGECLSFFFDDADEQQRVRFFLPPRPDLSEDLEVPLVAAPLV